MRDITVSALHRVPFAMWNLFVFPCHPSQSAFYTILRLRRLTSPPALFIDPKATCVSCVLLHFHLKLSYVSRHLRTPPTHTHTSTPSCMFLSTLEPSALTTTNLQAFASLGWWRDFLAPTSSAAGAGVACVSDPAKITPHYPNETLARTAPIARAAQAGP